MIYKGIIKSRLLKFSASRKSYGMDMDTSIFLALGGRFDNDIDFLIEAHQKLQQPIDRKIKKLAIHQCRYVRLLQTKNSCCFSLFQTTLIDDFINLMGIPSSAGSPPCSRSRGMCCR